MGARLVVNRILNELEGRQPDVIEVQVVGAADALHASAVAPGSLNGFSQAEPPNLRVWPQTRSPSTCWVLMTSR